MLLAAFGFATLGPLARAAAEAGVSALTFSTWRSAVAVTVLVLFLAVLVRSGQATLTRWRDMPRIERLQLAIMGPFIAGTSRRHGRAPLSHPVKEDLPRTARAGPWMDSPRRGLVPSGPIPRTAPLPCP